LCLALNLRRGRQRHIGLPLDDLLDTLGQFRSLFSREFESTPQIQECTLAHPITR
jgi:hypothetical protein